MKLHRRVFLIVGAIALAIVPAFFFILVNDSNSTESQNSPHNTENRRNAQLNPTKTSKRARFGKIQSITEKYAFYDIDKQVAEILRSHPNILMFDGQQVTPQAQKLLNLSNYELTTIKSALNDAKSSLVAEYKSRARETDIQNQESTEYRIEAFPERSVEIRNIARHKIVKIVGNRLADLALNSLLANPTLLGFGMNDLRFQVKKPNNSENGSQSNLSSWIITHEEYLPGSDILISHNDWKAEDFIRLCNVFQ